MLLKIPLTPMNSMSTTKVSVDWQGKEEGPSVGGCRF